MTEEAWAMPSDWPGLTEARAPAAEVKAARAEVSVARPMMRLVKAGSAVRLSRYASLADA